MDRACQGEVGGELGEVERDDELAEGNQWPAPEKSRAAKSESQKVQGEDARRRRDVGKGDGEAGVDPQSPPQLRLVAEPCEVPNVSVVGFFLQLATPPRACARPKRLLQKLEGSYHSLPNPSTIGRPGRLGTGCCG